MERGVRLARVLPGLVLLTFLVGCAHREFAPGQRALFVHEELPAATRAVESARAVGRTGSARPRPREAEGLRMQAWTTYWGCNTARPSASPTRRSRRRMRSVRPPSPRRRGAATATLSCKPGHDRAGAVRHPDLVVDQRDGRLARPGSRKRGSERVPAGVPGQHHAVHDRGHRARRPGHGRRDGDGRTPSPAATVTLSANPATIVQGQCATPHLVVDERDGRLARPGESEAWIRAGPGRCARPAPRSTRSRPPGPAAGARPPRRWR